MSGAGKLCAALAAIMLLGITQPVQAFRTEQLVASGPSANRLDLVILGDGYRAEEQGQLTSDAQRMLDTLFSDEVWKRYRAYVNVKLVHVESNQSGADYGSDGGLRDTTLGTYYYCHDIERMLCADSTAVYAVALADAPEFDQIIVLVNDPKYGGAGGGFSTITAAASDLAVHEIGHSLFQLADEYSDPYPSYGGCDPSSDCFEPNVTLRTSRELVKWSHWIEESTPLPTPDEETYDQAIGAFEGARYESRDHFRPARSCKMRTLGVAFCAVCAEAGVLSMHTYGGPIDSVVPEGDVELRSEQRQTFRVVGPRPSPDTLSYNWSLDGSLIASNGLGTFELAASTMAPGTHTLSVDVVDATPLVRSDPTSLLISSRSWKVLRESSSASTIRVDAGSSRAYVDGLGQTWGADVHAGDGRVIDRGAIAVAGTGDDRLYQTGRIAITRYAIPVDNGQYTVRLHFAETSPAIIRPHQRVFRVRVEDRRVHQVDVFARTGGRYRALVLSEEVTVNDAVLDLRFTPLALNTLINAIEVIPSDADR